MGKRLYSPLNAQTYLKTARLTKLQRASPTYIPLTRIIETFAACVLPSHLRRFAKILRQANVFLDDSLKAVLADYGIAHYFNNSDFTSAKSTGTVRWTGPEVISLPPDPNPKLDKLDIFALGMTILEVRGIHAIVTLSPI
jgi:hypothetical protein